MFDFSNFFGGESKRPVEFIGLTEDETRDVLADRHGLSKALMQYYPDVTKRGDGPNAILKCLIVFEDGGRDTTYEDIGRQLGVSTDTVYQQMTKARKWVSAAFKQNIEHSGERVYLVTNQSLAAKAERLDGHLAKAERALESLRSDVNSIKQSGQTPVLPGKAAALLSGYEQVKALEAAE